MSDFHITEFKSIGNIPNVGDAQIAKGPVASQHLTLTGSNQQSAAVNVDTKFVRIATQTACFVAIAANPNALSGIQIFMPANSVDYFMIPNGHKIAAVTA